MQSKLALAQGDLNQAILFLLSSIEIHKKYFGEYNMNAIRMNIELGDIYRQDGNTVMAKERYQKAIECIDRSFIQNKNLRSQIINKFNCLNLDK